MKNNIESGQEQEQDYVDVKHDGKTITLEVKKKNMTFKNLLAEVDRIAGSKKDIVIDSRDIKAVVAMNEDTEPSELLIDFKAPGDLNERTAVPLTPWAHRQLAEKLNIPIKYYQRMNDQGHHVLLASNINEWMPSKERRMLRLLDGKCRAMLSDKFQPIDNFMVAREAYNKFEQVGLTEENIDSCHLTETHMYLRATVPWMRHEIAKGDVLKQGIIISNSEVGASAFRCEPFLWRQVCSNGLIAPSALTRVHLGARRDAGELFSDETHALEHNLIVSKIHDLIERTFDNENFEAWVANLKAANENEISSPTEAIDNFAKLYGIKDNTKDTILDNFVKEGNPSQWGFINSITATARDFDDAGAQVELERIAGQVSVMDTKEFQKKIAPLAVA